MTDLWRKKTGSQIEVNLLGDEKEVKVNLLCDEKEVKVNLLGDEKNLLGDASLCEAVNLVVS